jgi:hypothetical protein
VVHIVRPSRIIDRKTVRIGSRMGSHARSIGSGTVRAGKGTGKEVRPVRKQEYFV